MDWTAVRSTLNPEYFRILYRGRLKRVCHESQVEARLVALHKETSNG